MSVNLHFYVLKTNGHVYSDNLGPGIECFLKYKVDFKLRMESLAYENGLLEITEIIP